MSTKANGSYKAWAGNDKIRSFFGETMNKYMYGQITAEEFCLAVRQFYDEHEISVWDNEDLETLVKKTLPELVDKMEALGTPTDFPEAEQQKKIEAWILFKDCKRLLEERRLFSEERERYLKTGDAVGDEVEYSDDYLLVEREMETLVRAETGEGDYLGFCHLYWEVKKEVLRRKFGIVWRSPADRFPGMRFD